MRIPNIMSRKVGLPPGTLLMPERSGEKLFRINSLNYNRTALDEAEHSDIAQALDLISDSGTTWLDIECIDQLESLLTVKERLGIHSLVLEDILSTSQRQKIEKYEGYIFCIINNYSYLTEGESPRMERLNLILGPGYVITFRDSNSDILEPLKERLRNSAGLVRSKGAEYLFYCLLDLLVDRYFLVIDELNRKVTGLEAAVNDGRQKDTLERIYSLKNEILAIHRAVLPLRQMVLKVISFDAELMDEVSRIYLNDLLDHITIIAEDIQILREVVDNIFNIYQSILSFRMNDVMKILTIIGTIFIPITFIAGIYGMNFEFMPELKLKFGYPLAMGSMGLVAVIMLIFFKRKRWF